MVIFQLATTEATRFPYNMRSTSATRVTSFPFKGLRSLQGSIISKFPPQKKNTPISSGPPSGSLATPGIVKHSLLCQPCSFKVLHLARAEPPNPRRLPGSHKIASKTPIVWMKFSCISVGHGNCVLYTLLLYLIVGVRENVGVASWLWQSFVPFR